MMTKGIRGKYDESQGAGIRLHPCWIAESNHSDIISAVWKRIHPVGWWYLIVRIFHDVDNRSQPFIILRGFDPIGKSHHWPQRSVQSCIITLGGCIALLAGTTACPHAAICSAIVSRTPDSYWCPPRVIYLRHRHTGCTWPRPPWSPLLVYTFPFWCAQGSGCSFPRAQQTREGDVCMKAIEVF